MDLYGVLARAEFLRQRSTIARCQFIKSGSVLFRSALETGKVGLRIIFLQLAERPLPRDLIGEQLVNPVRGVLRRAGLWDRCTQAPDGLGVCKRVALAAKV